MIKRRFLTRLISIILFIVTFQILGIMLLVSLVMNPTLEEFKTILIHPLPMAYGLVAIYFVIVYIYIRPVLLYLNLENKGESLDSRQIYSAQDRCMNLAYFLAGLSFPAYVIGGVAGQIAVLPQVQDGGAGEKATLVIEFYS